MPVPSSCSSIALVEGSHTMRVSYDARSPSAASSPRFARASRAPNRSARDLPETLKTTAARSISPSAGSRTSSPSSPAPRARARSARRLRRQTRTWRSSAASSPPSLPRLRRHSTADRVARRSGCSSSGSFWAARPRAPRWCSAASWPRALRPVGPAVRSRTPKPKPPSRSSTSSTSGRGGRNLRGRFLSLPKMEAGGIESRLS